MYGGMRDSGKVSPDPAAWHLTSPPISPPGSTWVQILTSGAPDSTGMWDDRC